MNKQRPLVVLLAAVMIVALTASIGNTRGDDIAIPSEDPTVAGLSDTNAATVALFALEQAPSIIGPRTPAESTLGDPTVATSLETVLRVSLNGPQGP